MPTCIAHGIPCHYTVHGTGPAIVLIHGLGSGGVDWEPQQEYLKNEYTVITPDLYGHGETVDVPRNVTMENLSELISLILDTEGIQKAHLVGLSLGGAVSIQFALDYPDRVASLTAVNILTGYGDFSFFQRIQVMYRKALIKCFGMGQLSKFIAKRIFPNSPHLQARYISRHKKTDSTSYLTMFNALTSWAVTNRLTEIDIPTKIVASDNDYYPVVKYTELTSCISGATLSLITNANHAVTAEKPVEFNRVLKQFLSHVNKNAA